MPGAPLSLHVFEPRYRALVADCLAARTPFGVVCIRAGREVGPGDVALAPVGTFAEIREGVRRRDGSLDVVVHGTARFRLAAVDATRRLYLVGTAVPLPELLGDAARARRLAARVRLRFVRYLALLQAEWDADGGAETPSSAERNLVEGARAGGGAGAPEGGHPPGRLEAIAALVATMGDPVTTAHAVSGLLQVELPQRQRLLEAETAEARLAGLDALLAQEIALLARRLAPYAPTAPLPSLRRN